MGEAVNAIMKYKSKFQEYSQSHQFDLMYSNMKQDDPRKRCSIEQIFRLFSWPRIKTNIDEFRTELKKFPEF